MIEDMHWHKVSENSENTLINESYTQFLYTTIHSYGLISLK